MTYRLTTLILAAAGALSAGAQGKVVAHFADSTRLTLSVEVSEPDTAGTDYSVISMPMLVGQGGDTLRLPAAVFRGKRNARLADRDRYFGTKAPATMQEVAAGDTVRLSRTFLRKDMPWMWQGNVAVVAGREKEGCCRVEPLAQAPIGMFRYVPPFVPAIAPVPDNTGKAGELQRSNPVLQHISEYRPYDDTRILRKEKGALYVHFPLDKWTLRREFRDNAPTLDRIVEITRLIMADTTSAVKKIQIIGLASVEGPQKRNLLLGRNRAEALRRYVQDRVPTPDSLYECVNGGEAWTELRSQIEDLQFGGRDELLRIIRTEPDPNRRERLIKRLDGGRPYSYLRTNVLSDQRNSGYLRIYYDYVPDLAARDINRASELIKAGRYAEALALLTPHSADPRSWNALGVARYMTGSRADAIALFRKAAGNGNAQAKRNLEQMEEIKRAENRE